MSKRPGGGQSKSSPEVGAGSALPPPDDRVLIFADSLQHERAEADERVHQWEMWVTCRIEREVFALPVKQVQEILRVSALTRVPHAPFPVRGPANYLALLVNRARMEGMVVFDYAARYPEAVQRLGPRWPPVHTLAMGVP